MKHFLSVFVFTLWCLGISAQSSPLRFQHLTIDDGLSQSSVYTVFRDSKGYMWFGTEDGLNRYDGYHFQVFGTIGKEGGTLCYKWIESIADPMMNMHN